VVERRYNALEELNTFDKVR